MIAQKYFPARNLVTKKSLMENFIFCAEYLDFLNGITSYFYEVSNA